MSLSRDQRRVAVLGLVAIIAVYFLILVGGTVRATGAGMGCPDWPLCFGQLIPPTDESQLPANWRDIYSHRGYASAPFDPVKTWIEYVNRLVGVVIGLLIVAFVALSARLRKSDATVFWVAVIALLAVMFNGWLGSRVVASNLRPVVISLHMAGAFLVQMALIYATVRAARHSLVPSGPSMPGWFRNLLLVTLAALVLQIILGIQIRESVDWISRSMNEVDRDDWIALVPGIFYVHRSFSWVILGLAGFMTLRILRSHLRRTAIGRAAVGLVALVVFEMLLGGALNHLGFPAVAQPTHLLVAHLIFGVLWFQWCLLSVAQIDGTPSSSSLSPSDRNSYV